MNQPITQTNLSNATIHSTIHLLRCDRPDFRRAAIPPCRFMPFNAGRAVMPFESLHCSRRELRGPCVDIRFGEVEGPAPESSSIASSVKCLLEERGREERGNSNADLRSSERRMKIHSKKKGYPKGYIQQEMKKIRFVIRIVLLRRRERHEPGTVSWRTSPGSRSSFASRKNEKIVNHLFMTM